MTYAVIARTSAGQEYRVVVERGETVGDFRKKIAKLVGTAEFQIICSERNMEDDYKFAEGSQPCQTFHIIFPTKSMANNMVETARVLGAVVVGAVVLVLAGEQLTRKRVS